VGARGGEKKKRERQLVHCGGQRCEKEKPQKGPSKGARGTLGHHPRGGGRGPWVQGQA